MKYIFGVLLKRLAVFTVGAAGLALSLALAWTAFETLGSAPTATFGDKLRYMAVLSAGGVMCLLVLFSLITMLAAIFSEEL